jgi:hypothetical protein
VLRQVLRHRFRVTGRQLINQTQEYVEGDFCEYLKESSLVEHQVSPVDISSLSHKDKLRFLKQFKEK